MSSKWSSSTVYELLKDENILAYAGCAVWNKTQRRPKKVGKPKEEWIIVENAHPAIIALEEAQQIIAAKRRSDRRPVRGIFSDYLLTNGLLKCGRRGSNMVIRRVRDRQKRVTVYYACSGYVYRKECRPTY